jgi:hypothetical protein
LDAATLQSNIFQELLQIFNSPPGAEITFQVMAVTIQSTCDDYTVSTILECSQNIEHIQFARAW